jgi:hypothetical protein
MKSNNLQNREEVYPWGFLCIQGGATAMLSDVGIPIDDWVDDPSLMRLRVVNPFSVSRPSVSFFFRRYNLF